MISWIILSFIAVFCWAVVNVNDKYIISSLNIPTRIAVIGTGLVGLCSAIIASIYWGFIVLPLFHITLALLGGVCFMLMIIFYLGAIKREEVSRVIPLFSLSPLFILIIAHFFFQEKLTGTQYTGIMLLIVASMLISVKSLKKFHITFASILMIFAALSWGMHQLISDYLVQFHDYWAVFTYMRIGAFLVVLPDLFYYRSSIQKVYRKKGIKPFFLLGASEALYVVGILLATLATSLGPVTLVNGILVIQPFFVLFITIILTLFLPKIIKEGIDRDTLILKISSIAMMVVGTILIS